MAWTVLLHEDFAREFGELSETVQDRIAEKIGLLKQVGPQLARPHCDTLKGSQHANMKELRFNADKGVWRLAFAFDEGRNAILLVCGNKAGRNEDKFYETLIATADRRFNDWLTSQ